jgi:hypothetical protein
LDDVEVLSSSISNLPFTVQESPKVGIYFQTFLTFITFIFKIQLLKIGERSIAIGIQILAVET